MRVVQVQNDAQPSFRALRAVVCCFALLLPACSRDKGAATKGGDSGPTSAQRDRAQGGASKEKEDVRDAGLGAAASPDSALPVRRADLMPEVSALLGKDGLPRGFSPLLQGIELGKLRKLRPRSRGSLLYKWVASEPLPSPLLSATYLFDAQTGSLVEIRWSFAQALREDSEQIGRLIEKRLDQKPRRLEKDERVELEWTRPNGRVLLRIAPPKIAPLLIWCKEPG